MEVVKVAKFAIRTTFRDAGSNSTSPNKLTLFQRCNKSYTFENVLRLFCQDVQGFAGIEKPDARCYFFVASESSMAYIDVQQLTILNGSQRLRS